MPDYANFQSSYNAYNYNAKEIRKYEQICLKLLHYKLNHYTIYDYIELLLNNGIVFINDKCSEGMVEDIYKQCKNIAVNLIIDNRSLGYTPLQLACSVVCFSRNMIRPKELWPETFLYLYKI